MEGEEPENFRKTAESGFFFFPINVINFYDFNRTIPEYLYLLRAAVFWYCKRVQSNEVKHFIFRSANGLRGLLGNRHDLMFMF